MKWRNDRVKRLFGDTHQFFRVNKPRRKPWPNFCSIVLHNRKPHDTTMVRVAFDNFCPKIFETNLNFS